MALRMLALSVALVAATAASAHHPGSHAARQPDGRVQLDLAVTVRDSCTRVAEVAAGPPPGVAAAPGASPVTVRLARSGDACEAAASVIRAERSLALPGQAGQILVYVLGTDGALASTERVPLR